jgi:hypothetical protein
MQLLVHHRFKGVVVFIVVYDGDGPGEISVVREALINAAMRSFAA